MRILVAFDGSDSSRRALTHAAEIVGRGGRLDVINVIGAQPVGASVDALGNGKRHRQRDLLQQARGLLAEHDVRMTSVAAIGDPTTEIRAAAEKCGAVVIVVGRGTGLRRLIDGSVSARLVRRAPCDVLVVR